MGANSVTLVNASSFQVGQEIFIRKTLSAEWIEAMGMNKLVRDGRSQTWIKAGRVDVIPRQITSINYAANVITFDVPLVDSIDASYQTNANAVPYKLPVNLASGNSIEDLQIILAHDESGHSLLQTSFAGRSCLASHFLSHELSQASPLSMHTAKTTGSEAYTQPTFSPSFTLSPILAEQLFKTFRCIDLRPLLIKLATRLISFFKVTLVWSCGVRLQEWQVVQVSLFSTK